MFQLDVKSQRGRPAQREPYRSPSLLRLVCSHSLGFWLPILVAQRFFRDIYFFAAQLGFKSRQLCFDVGASFALANHFLPVSTEEVVDRLDSNANRAGWLVLVEILKAEVRCPRLLDDTFDDSINRSIVAAFEA